MTTEIIIHADDFTNEKEFLRSEIEKWIRGKLDSYIKKYAKEDNKIRIEARFFRGKKGFSGKIHLTTPAHAFHTEREDFEKLEDLVLHLISHLKDQMAE